MFPAVMSFLRFKTDDNRKFWAVSHRMHMRMPVRLFKVDKVSYRDDKGIQHPVDVKSSAFDDEGCNGHNRDGGYDDGDHDADRELILVAVIDDQRAFGQCVHREVHQCELECPGGLIVSLLHLLQPFDPATIIFDPSVADWL